MKRVRSPSTDFAYVASILRLIASISSKLVDPADAIHRRFVDFERRVQQLAMDMAASGDEAFLTQFMLMLEPYLRTLETAVDRYARRFVGFVIRYPDAGNPFMMSVDATFRFLPHVYAFETIGNDTLVALLHVWRKYRLLYDLRATVEPASTLAIPGTSSTNSTAILPPIMLRRTILAPRRRTPSHVTTLLPRTSSADASLGVVPAVLPTPPLPSTSNSTRPLSSTTALTTVPGAPLTYGPVLYTPAVAPVYVPAWTVAGNMIQTLNSLVPLSLAVSTALSLHKS